MGYSQSRDDNAASAVVESALFLSRNHCYEGKKMGSTVRTFNHRVCGTKAESGEGTKRGTHSGHPTTSPPDNLPTAHSGLHSLRGFRHPLAPPTSWEVIEAALVDLCVIPPLSLSVTAPPLTVWKFAVTPKGVPGSPL